MAMINRFYLNKPQLPVTSTVAQVTLAPNYTICSRSYTKPLRDPQEPDSGMAEKLPIMTMYRTFLARRSYTRKERMTSLRCSCLAK